MEQAILWGIEFSSAGHMNWFIFSMICFGISTGWCLITLGIKLIMRLNIKLSSTSLYTTGWALGMTGHFWTSIMAIIFTKFGTENGRIYSVDCIWFNALMGVIYMGLCLLVGFIGRKLDPITQKS